MKFAVGISVLVLLLNGCKVNEGESFDRDATPEERTEYQGVEGVVQSQKDKVYLMDKALTDKCKNAKVDHAVAITNNDIKAQEEQLKIIKSTCR
ncbi:hypothetical protein [Pseudoalteromonas luteoviolacea]|uniref:Uncharacterized protein n=1 Tax=Pseudoalteromonas luteoviolacea S4054 TaxID=1129367 RepID=A0A0F6AAB4_9GAMM|nr:hypothetical protein [Pseudoalteromonas luteoviolacea]AOT09435.1 hypothetical protein S4054249_16965 [Pseudoalteromonas luteoviolacea]AOT14347.1 hypothetical protein S40542_16935 [Pseudoalteromonas luteoviolacea]AOT19263.1 hypothetical protein S4054_16940 [Pseudoalteromonas luteoviolacea]KKE83147.1 hypothetical protein N479_15890 [Pseudoalteromonas luteoviolacea S4054]KZN73538.1 hypothetical protein N481_12555 [Pseudoalteromonas luteoviolacea S4047-1]